MGPVYGLQGHFVYSLFFLHSVGVRDWGRFNSNFFLCVLTLLLSALQIGYSRYLILLIYMQQMVLIVAIIAPFNMIYCDLGHCVKYIDNLIHFYNLIFN